MADLTTKSIFTFDNSIYLLSAPGTWGAAQAEAQSFGGNLVTINNATEQTFLVGLFEGQILWTGYNDSGVEGTFQWISGETSTYTNWANGDPNNYAGAEDYAVLSSNGNWVDLAGSDRRQGIIEIKNPATPILVIEDLGVLEPTSGSAQAVFTVRRYGNSNGYSTVNYSTADGTTTAGGDYSAASGTLVFNPGETVKTISVTVSQDADAVSAETFFVNLTSPGNATLGDSKAKATIREATDAVTFGGHTYLLTNPGNWGEAQQQARAFGGNLVTINSAEEQSFLAGVYAGQTLWIGYSDAGQEWNATTAEGFQWVSGERSAYTNWADGDPNNYAGAEDFVALFNNGSWGDLEGSRNFKGIIEISQSVTPPNPTLSINDPTVPEAVGKLAFTVTLSQASSQPVSVDYQTVNGTAIAGSDYTAVAGKLTFAAGETTKVIEVPVLNDTLKEADETLSLIVSNPIGATIVDNQGVGTILNDDQRPGDDGDDVLVGDMGDNQLFGDIGQDNLDGMAGDDLLCGGAGNDLLTGGAGRDRFLFDLGKKFVKSEMGVDRITDFTKGDKILLDRTTFVTLKQISFESVRNIAQAKTSEASITYIRSTGALFYNENGEKNGFGAGGLFADLTNGLKLTKADLAIVR